MRAAAGLLAALTIATTLALATSARAASAAWCGTGEPTTDIRSKVANPIGPRGYRVTVAGRSPVVVTGTTVSFPRAGVHGKKVSVAVVDRSGNVGQAAIAHLR